MSIETQLRARLVGEAGVLALVNTRVYPLILPQSPTLPALTYQKVSNSGQDGTSRRKLSRWQIDCWAETMAGADALALAVRAALEEWHDVPGIEYARVVNDFSDYDDEVDVYRYIGEVMLHTTGD